MDNKKAKSFRCDHVQIPQVDSKIRTGQVEVQVDLEVKFLLNLNDACGVKPKA